MPAQHGTLVKLQDELPVWPSAVFFDGNARDPARLSRYTLEWWHGRGRWRADEVGNTHSSSTRTKGGQCRKSCARSVAYGEAPVEQSEPLARGHRRGRRVVRRELFRSFTGHRTLVRRRTPQYRVSMAAVREDVVRRLLVSKRFLEVGGLLTPDSDAAAVGSAVLAAHDAAELALNAIASHLNVQVKEHVTMFGYVEAIDRSGRVPQPLSGRPLLGRLNAARRGLKHNGVFPNASDWYRILDLTREVVDAWCATHLDGLKLDDIDLAVLIEDPEVRKLHGDARLFFDAGRYREALEAIGRAHFLLIRGMPGTTFFLGLHGPDTNRALAASAYGVRPSDLLNLEGFLPNVSQVRDGTIDIEWDSRARGHEGNWREDAVGYCLEVFVDVAIKLQHARPVPIPWPFVVIFDDVIRAKRDGVPIWKDKVEGLPPLQRVVGRENVAVLNQGEELRGHLPVSKKSGFESVLQPKGDDTEDVLDFYFENDQGRSVFARVLKSDVDILSRPKDSPELRGALPHLFPEDDE
jgi:hypothetical protein